MRNCERCGSDNDVKITTISGEMERLCEPCIAEIEQIIEQEMIEEGEWI